MKVSWWAFQLDSVHEPSPGLSTGIVRHFLIWFGCWDAASFIPLVLTAIYQELYWDGAVFYVEFGARMWSVLPVYQQACILRNYTILAYIYIGRIMIHSF